MTSYAALTTKALRNHDHQHLAFFSLQIQKKLKQEPIICCDKCLKFVAKRRACADCKTVFYCSKKCQKADWPLHRLTCTVRTISTKRFVPALRHNSILMALIVAIFIKRFNLTEEAPGPSSGPFILGVSLGMFPPGWRGLTYEGSTLPGLPPLEVTLPDFSIFRRKPQRPGIDVFLQIIHFATPTILHSRLSGYESTHRALWAEDAKRTVSKPTNDPMHFIGLLMICHGGKSVGDFDNIFPVPIRKSEIEGYKSGSLFSEAERALGEPIPRPIEIETLCQYINLHIEADLNNCFRLRRRLRCKEEALVRWARDVLSAISRRQVTTEEVLQRLKVVIPDVSEVGPWYWNWVNNSRYPSESSVTVVRGPS